jgi:hypothetical protein
VIERPVLLHALARPQVITAFLLLLGAAALFFIPSGPATSESQEFVLPEVTPAGSTTAEIRLVTYDRFDLETSTSRTLDVPTGPALRLAAVLQELQATLQADGIWPAGLPAPLVFVETLNRQRTAILDFQPPADLLLPVSHELRLLQSIEATVLANGLDSVHFLLHGQPAGLFLVNVAVPDSL